ncbi:MAG: glycosyltransferase family 4 protein [Paraprevotella sp.]|nr:glycosyltransferase family 4 protein [Paraprevotella sp.]
MKILMYTPSFYPRVGGLETVNYLIAQGLSRCFDITVITPVLDEDNEHEYSFRILRTTSTLSLLKESVKCDVFVHSVLSLKAILPALLSLRKWFVIHHTCYFRVWDQSDTTASRLKKLFSHLAHNICVSGAVGKSLGLANYSVIHNAYDSSLFKNYECENRNGFVFVGRLVTEKGVDFLINAYLEYLSRSDRKQKLFIIGEGPMMEVCKKIISDARQEDNIILKGQLKGKALVDELNERYCMVVPSVYKEAFGIVALEGLATGCHVIGSDGDGISEAMGACGSLFQKGDADSLVEEMLDMDCIATPDKKAVFEHLRMFTPDYMVQRYVDYFKSWERK